MNKVTFVLGPRGNGGNEKAKELAIQNPNGYVHLHISSIIKEEPNLAVVWAFKTQKTIIIDGVFNLYYYLMFLLTMESAEILGYRYNRPPVIIVSNNIIAEHISHRPYPHFEIITLPAQ